MKERLHKLIKEKTSNKLENRAKKQGTYNVREIAKIIRKELNCFKQEKVRGKYLNLIYKYLLTIRPTSVEAERAFSAAGLLCTKIRSSLSDESINTLCFLRAHFIQCNKT